MKMERIKDILAHPINKGYINWDKLEEKIHAALALVKGDFNSFKPDGTEHPVKLDDAVDFNVKTPQGDFIYKLIEPRFFNAQLYCSGYQLGFLTSEGKPWFNPQTLVRF